MNFLTPLRLVHDIVHVLYCLLYILSIVHVKLIAFDIKKVAWYMYMYMKYMNMHVKDMLILLICLKALCIIIRH